MKTSIDLGEDFGLMEVEEDELFEGIVVQGKQAKKPTVKELNAKVHRQLDNDDLGLNEIWEKANDKREWIEDSAVVLIHTQVCLGCGAVHSWSHGWFTGKHHSRDRTASSLAAGKPIGYYPRRCQVAG
jgi:hypothetical protein